MLTGHTEVSDLIVGIDAGADLYLRKPAHAAELLAKLKAGCRRIERERQVHVQAMTDHLLGIFNRRYLIEWLPREITGSQRYARSLAAVMADLDHFKQVNDRHGHPIGDQVIQEFVTRARACLRASDWAARYGGEEFIFVLPETGIEPAVEIAERIRLARASTPVETTRGRLAITASFGVAALSPNLPADHPRQRTADARRPGSVCE